MPPAPPDGAVLSEVSAQLSIRARFLPRVALRWRRWRLLPFAAFVCVGACVGASVGIVAAAEYELIAPQSAQLPASSQLERVQNLVRANVLGLARAILETEGPPLRADAQWLAWERQLWSVYRAQRDWRRLRQRAAAIPSSFPAAIRREAALQAIDALIALDRGADARALIRRQLLAADAAAADASESDSAARDPFHLRRLREALIESYLRDDMIADARIALDRLRKDYGARGIDSALRSAGVLLRSGDADGAINLLAPRTQPSARLLRLYARLRNQTLTPAQVIARADELMPSLKTPRARRDAHAVIAQARRAADEPAASVEALEAYLSRADSAFEPRGAHGVYPRFAPSDLLDAYRALAQREANNAGLLVGDEAQWLAHARALPSERATARRALFAHIAQQVAPGALRQSASDGYVGALIDADRTALIARMFGDDAPLGALALSGEVGVRLSAHALAHGDLALAADANARITALPSALARADWLLSAGRIDIHAGHHQRGAARLHEWLASFARLTATQADAVLQVLFDLQTASRHRLALALLHEVRARAPAGKHRREIAYWLGESYHADGQYLRAADWFLHSALLQDDGFDRWGAAARYRAAESLASAELLDDAARLFADLLARADDDARRNALQRRLQQLRLRQRARQAQ